MVALPTDPAPEGAGGVVVVEVELAHPPAAVAGCVLGWLGVRDQQVESVAPLRLLAESAYIVHVALVVSVVRPCVGNIVGCQLILALLTGSHLFFILKG